MANGYATGAVMSSGGLSEFSRMLSVFINCSKLKASALPNPSSGPQLQTNISFYGRSEAPLQVISGI